MYLLNGKRVMNESIVSQMNLGSIRLSGYGVILSKTYQSLHRLYANRMKLSELVELVPVSINVRLKNFESLAKGSK